MTFSSPFGIVYQWCLGCLVRECCSTPLLPQLSTQWWVVFGIEYVFVGWIRCVQWGWSLGCDLDTVILEYRLRYGRYWTRRASVGDLRSCIIVNRKKNVLINGVYGVMYMLFKILCHVSGGIYATPIKSNEEDTTSNHYWPTLITNSFHYCMWCKTLI